MAASAAQDAAAGLSWTADKCRVAVGQMTAVGDQLLNFNTCKQLAEQAATAGCSMLFLPECFSFIGTSQQESLAKAEPLEGPAMARYRQLAREGATGSCWHLIGLRLEHQLPVFSIDSQQVMIEVGPDPEHLYNCHVILDNAGGTVATYRKVHLFDVDVPNGPVLMESRTTAPGDKLIVCDSPAGRLGLTICYDLRFPEVYQKLTWQMGAQVLLVPSAFTKVTGAAHWEVLLRARAIECQCYVIAAAQAGVHNSKRESYGHALIIDPWGVVIGRLPDPSETGIAVADLDLKALQAVRVKMPIQQHRARGRTQLGQQIS
eukprot:gene10801-10957_t